MMARNFCLRSVLAVTTVVSRPHARHRNAGSNGLISVIVRSIDSDWHQPHVTGTLIRPSFSALIASSERNRCHGVWTTSKLGCWRIAYLQAHLRSVAVGIYDELSFPVGVLGKPEAFAAFDPDRGGRVPAHVRPAAVLKGALARLDLHVGLPGGKTLDVFDRSEIVRVALRTYQWRVLRCHALWVLACHQRRSFPCPAVLAPEACRRGRAQPPECTPKRSSGLDESRPLGAYQKLIPRPGRKCGQPSAEIRMAAQQERRPPMGCLELQATSRLLLTLRSFRCHRGR